jgi:VIT1/CCC1 family predicted Fe2+/Mn2+ transporter
MTAAGKNVLFLSSIVSSRYITTDNRYHYIYLAHKICKRFFSITLEETRMLTRNLDKAKEAFLRRNPDLSRQAHSRPADEAEEEHSKTAGKYLKSLVYGGLDGIITTFAVVAGVAGASLSSGVVLILGFANLIADGLSMAIGDYLSTKAETEYNQAERAREAWEVDNYPEGEKKEMVELYTAKGLSQEEADTITNILSRKKEAWISIMMVEELGIVASDESPLMNALVTFVSFVVFGFIPLLIYVLSGFFPAFKASSFPLSTLLTAATLFTLGALKVKFTNRNWLVSGLEMMLVGGLAAAAAYGIGVLLSGLA